MVTSRLGYRASTIATRRGCRVSELTGGGADSAWMVDGAGDSAQCFAV